MELSGEEECHAPTSWGSLDAHCQLVVLSFLDARSLATFSCVCSASHHLAKTCSLWAPLLGKYFGLEAKVKVRDQALLQKTFGLMRRARARYPVRFAGAATDSGVDERSPLYWCDNLFV